MSTEDYKFKNIGISTKKSKRNSAYARSKSEIKLPIGISTPLKQGYRNNESLFQMHFDLASQLEDNLKNLLMTRNGERLCFYSYGTSLNEVYSDTATSQEEKDEKAMFFINRTVSKFMPFIELLNFSSNKKEDLSNSKETEYELIITYIIPGIETKRSISLSLRTTN